MDIRIRRIRGEEKSHALSRSFPTSGKPNCFQQCLNTSTDSLTSEGCRSPKLGQYRKLPTHSECDVCHILTKETVNLKCLHTFCSKCLERHKIFKNGCPVCDHYVEENSHAEEKPEIPSEDLIFDDFEDDTVRVDSAEELIDKLEFEVLGNVEAVYYALENEIDRLNTDVDKEIAKIQEYVKNLKFLIDKRTEALIKSANESKVRHCAELQRQKRSVKEFIGRMKEAIKVHRENLTWVSYNDIQRRNEAEDSLRALINLSAQITEERVHIKHTARPLSEASLDFMGKVGVRVFTVKPLSVSLSKSFRFPGAVHSICPVSRDQAWVGYQNYIQLCSKTGNHHEPIDVGEDVHDIAADREGKIVIACHSSVKCLNESRDVKTLFQCARTPQGIGVLENKNIVYCAGNQIHVASRDGRLVSSFGDGKGIDMKMPYKIAVSANGDVCVSDYQSSSGDVVVFDCGGMPLARLRTEGMAPRGLACNIQGIIYVTDFRADRINLYSTHGHFLQTLINANSNGLSGPLSIAVDETGDLWVGDWKRKVRIFKQFVVVKQRSVSE